MERVFKIKTKTNGVQSTYPSERRYSASMVIGLSVVYLQLFLYSILMGTLITYKMTDQHYPNITSNKTDDNINIPIMLKRNSETYINVPILECSSCLLMALGHFLAFGMGVLAWKRWYIDHNITFFFLASIFSSLTTTIGLLLSILTYIHVDYDYDTYVYDASRVSPITFSLALNVTILSFIGVIWSVLAAKVAYVGMKSGYPDDLVFGKGDRCVEVSIEQRKSEVFPQDIIEHFPSGDKLAKYIPKRENENLPKSESILEFQQRVEKFLYELPDNSVKNN